MLNIETLKSDIACLRRVREQLMKYGAGEKALAVIDGMIDGNEHAMDALWEAWKESHTEKGEE